MTHSLTYDPVVDAQPLPRVRPPRTPPPGRALVLAPGGMYLVDTTEHRLALDLRLPGRDAPDAFHCHLRLMCRVTDPAEIVARGIRDMSAAWYDPLHARLRDVSRRYGTEQLREAEEALNTALRRVTGAPAVRLYDARAELRALPGLLEASGPSRVRGVPRVVTGPRPTPGGAEVLRGEVLARKEEPLPPPSPAPTRRASRVRGTTATGEKRTEETRTEETRTGEERRSGEGPVTGP
ncbi:hypothetical protein ACFZBP_23035 [Streptomyces sp. NPDC008086]|uniref:hypothetical protein n=1 Tax=Streptomyces sp. NPDC008086 TaxID=3364807 RepID=UPI0036EF0BE7